MMIHVLFMDEQVILATTTLMCSVTAVMNFPTFHRTAQTLHHQERSLQGINIPTLKGTDHIPIIMVTDMGDISTSHNHITAPILTGATAVSEEHYTLHPTTTVIDTNLWQMDISIAIHTTTHPTGIVAPHLALTTSPTDISHATIPWTRTSLGQATPTTLHSKHSH